MTPDVLSMSTLNLRSGSSANIQTSYALASFGANHDGASPNASPLTRVAALPVSSRSLFRANSWVLNAVWHPRSHRPLAWRQSIQSEPQPASEGMLLKDRDVLTLPLVDFANVHDAASTPWRRPEPSEGVTAHRIAQYFKGRHKHDDPVANQCECREDHAPEDSAPCHVQNHGATRIRSQGRPPFGLKR